MGRRYKREGVYGYTQPSESLYNRNEYNTAKQFIPIKEIIMCSKPRLMQVSNMTESLNVETAVLYSTCQFPLPLIYFQGRQYHSSHLEILDLTLSSSSLYSISQVLQRKQRGDVATAFLSER